MTIWDQIYRNYQNGGIAWATIEGRILPQFTNFLKTNKFTIRHALEIGCGTGKYLMLLKDFGFKTDGIDSSKTAVKMTMENLKDNSSIKVADMFKYNIPQGRYDLIFSIFSIHHGYKAQIKKTMKRIYDSLLAGGKFFITLPDHESNKRWNTFKDDKELGDGTFVPLSGPEKGLPHSFYTRMEIRELFKRFANVKIKSDPNCKIIHSNWIIYGEK